MTNPRVRKIADRIQVIVAEMLERRVKDPRLGFVTVTDGGWDTNQNNFSSLKNSRIPPVDQALPVLLEDLADRGMLDSTLIVVMSEFGRTPNINKYYGRDHWGTAWSICLGGGKIVRGAVVGKTNANGTKVIEREVSYPHLFHTYLAGLGLDSHEPFEVGGRPVPMADPAFGPIDELIT